MSEARSISSVWYEEKLHAARWKFILQYPPKINITNGKITWVFINGMNTIEVENDSFTDAVEVAMKLERRSRNVRSKVF